MTSKCHQNDVPGPSADVRLFSCAADADRHRGDDFACLANPVNSTTLRCREGYDGALCGSCQTNYTRHHRVECVECTTAAESLRDRYVRLVIICILLGLLFAACAAVARGKSLAHFLLANVKELVDVAAPSLKIVIGMAQITSQFSAVSHASARLAYGTCRLTRGALHSGAGLSIFPGDTSGR